MTEAVVSEGQVWEALGTVTLPEGGNVSSRGLVSGLSIRGGVVSFAIEIESGEADAKEPLRDACSRAVAAVPGVARVNAVLTASAHAPKPADPGANPIRHTVGATAKTQHLPYVKAIVAVASGKGGVGKSTTAVNLALGIQAEGLKVGLLDADIYGPSLPRLLGVGERKPEVRNRTTIIPVEAFGLRTMSMGYLVPEDTATIWRGPMVTGAIQQLLRTVEWGELDVLVIDFPPGTGDAHLTLAQTVAITGAVIVSTPQDIALIDARKGAKMFEKVAVPVLGIVENMSYFVCPHCGERSEIFGYGGAKAEAEATMTAFLGEIPLDARIRETSDAGTPIVAADPHSPQAESYLTLARGVIEKLGQAEGTAPPPVIREE